MDGLLVGWELSGWSYLKGCTQWLNVQMEIVMSGNSQGVVLGLALINIFVGDMVSLPMTPNCAVQSRCWGKGIPSRGTWMIYPLTLSVPLLR